MKKLFFLVALFLLFSSASSSLWALSGQPKEEFDQFIRGLREEKRVERIGYLVRIDLPVSKSSDEKIFPLAGKIIYAAENFYLSHVNYARLDKIKKAKIRVSIIDKKRMDDPSEAWYLVWVESLEEENVLREHFEPLFKHEHTVLVRIRPEDEEILMNNKLRYSLVEESLLPLRRPFQAMPAKTIKVDPMVQKLLTMVTKEALASSVQTLEDYKSRYVSMAGNSGATEWLAGEFAKIKGLEIATPTFNANSGKLSNVVAVKRGQKDPKAVYVVCGHFDSTVSSYDKKFCPGADDNGTGAAAVLELAKVLADVKLPFTVVFAGWNAEEIGLVGSKAYAKTITNQPEFQIKAVFNMDMIADKDDNEVAVIGNTASNWLIDVFKDAALAYTGLKSNTLYNSKIWYSDHSSFWNIGASAILTIEGYPEMSAYYHSVNDLTKNLAPSLMEKIARSNLAALLTLNQPLPADQSRR